MRFNVLHTTALLCLVALAQPVTGRSALAQDAGGMGGGPDGGGPGGGGPGGGGGGGRDAGAGAKNRLDAVLSVLRDHQRDAGKPCLDAMTEVHKTEDQVADLGQRDSNSNRPDNGADIAGDVLESDYETAEAACRPDAERACRADPANRECARLGGPGPR